MNKLKLIIFNSDKQEIKKYKSLKLIERDYPTIPYHSLREIYLFSTNRKNRKLHGFNLKLSEKMKIVDDEEDVEL
jgi:hypothetical protein